MISKKIAMLGMWGVGKTSLVQQFVHSIYDEKYHSTLGVKVDKKAVSIDDAEVTLMLWDIAGAEKHFDVPVHYVKGAAGYLLVIDGTREETLTRGLELVEHIRTGVGDLPFVPVINKSDLPWEISDADIEARLGAYGPVLRSSAKTGEGVEEAFLALGRKIL